MWLSESTNSEVQPRLETHGKTKLSVTSPPRGGVLLCGKVTKLDVLGVGYEMTIVLEFLAEHDAMANRV
jgi:hypothetical protein